MKKSLIGFSALALIMSASTNVIASENGAGCGVGKMVMEGKDGKNANITAALINVAINMVFPHQLSGMTTGTLGCDVTQEVKNEQERETFFAKNENDLTIEMAQGNGSHLHSFASMMGINEQDKDVFFSALQDNYETIVTSDNVLASIDQTMLQHPSLSKYIQ